MRGVVAPVRREDLVDGALQCDGCALDVGHAVVAARARLEPAVLAECAAPHDQRTAGRLGEDPFDDGSPVVGPVAERERHERADLAAVLHLAQPFEGLRLRAQDEPREVLLRVELGPVAFEVDGRDVEPALEQVADEIGERRGRREHTGVNGRERGVGARPAHAQDTRKLGVGRADLDVRSDLGDRASAQADLLRVREVAPAARVVAVAPPRIDGDDHLTRRVAQGGDRRAAEHDIGVADVRVASGVDRHEPERLHRARLFPLPVEHGAHAGIALDDLVDLEAADEAHVGVAEDGERVEQPVHDTCVIVDVDDGGRDTSPHAAPGAENHDLAG